MFVLHFGEISNHLLCHRHRIKPYIKNIAIYKQDSKTFYKYFVQIYTFLEGRSYEILKCSKLVVFAWF
jgi:hypothetical protein